MQFFNILKNSSKGLFGTTITLGFVIIKTLYILTPDIPREAHVVIDLPDTPDVVVISSGDEGHQGEEDDPEEDQDIDEVGVE